MKFLKALFNIISIINPFRIYNCILCFNSSERRAGGLKTQLRGWNFADVFRAALLYLGSFADENRQECTCRHTCKLNAKSKAARFLMLPNWYNLIAQLGYTCSGFRFKYSKKNWNVIGGILCYLAMSEGEVRKNFVGGIGVSADVLN